MSSKDNKIETVAQALDGAVEKKAAGMEDSLTTSVVDINDYLKRSSTSSMRRNTYGSFYTANELSKSKPGESEEHPMEDNKLLEMYMEKVDRDQRELRDDLREREERIEKQIVASEAREKERMDRIEKMIQSQNDLIQSQNEKIDALKSEVSVRLEDDKKYRHTNNIAIVLGVVATVLAMVGIYFATVSTITDIIGVAFPSV